jgi:AcrR family transcriptional regulator
VLKSGRGAVDACDLRSQVGDLERSFREAEGLSIAQIAERLGRSPATVKAYFYDPAGEKARAVKARYMGVCQGCGAYTQPRNGKGDAYRYCKRCHPVAIQPKRTRDVVIAAMLEWHKRYGRLPSPYDWSRTHAKRRGGVALTRLNEREWPSASVGDLFGSWRTARGAVAAAAIPCADRASPGSVGRSAHFIDACLRGVWTGRFRKALRPFDRTRGARGVRNARPRGNCFASDG